LIIILAFLGIGLIIGIPLLTYDQPDIQIEEGFPEFITDNEDYFITRIGDVPNIDPDTYELVVWGQIDNPRTFNLTELLELELFEKTLTTECIGNTPKGSLISTAVWKGFSVYDLVNSLGLKENATGVRYTAADGYYVSHTLGQLKNNGTIGALFMNGVTLPPVQGFPLRIVNPGSYGAKQPAWVIEIEVIDRPLEDYWDFRSWDTSPPMGVDSTIFFPQNNVQVSVGKLITMGGAAFGGTRISKVEYTLDGGLNWTKVDIVRSLDLDHVWIFWNVTMVFTEIGTYEIYTRATDIFNNTQPQYDSNYRDGTNNWPSIKINVNY
jgi:DMSO/TMAO reductase YedYZ molybdopterin-dependent catalytic subunit